MLRSASILAQLGANPARVTWPAGRINGSLFFAPQSPVNGNGASIASDVRADVAAVLADTDFVCLCCRLFIY